MTTTILVGDVRTRLQELPDESVDCVVTSPPYWLLRDYGMPAVYWPEMSYSPMAGMPPITIPAMECSLGSEPTLDAFIGHNVLVFQSVHRVLKSEGTVWVNMGDSYAGGGNGGGGSFANDGCRAPRPGTDKNIPARSGDRGVTGGLKRKDLCGVPWRLALALQAAGYYLRSDCVWDKSNPMPESVTDRPTKSHEYIFLLTKSERYYFNSDAIKEPVVGDPSASRNRWDTKTHEVPGQKPLKRVARAPGNKTHKGTAAYEAGDQHHRTKGGLLQFAEKMRARSVDAAAGAGKHRATAEQASGHRMVNSTAKARAEGGNHNSPFGDFRNKRTVWRMATYPYREAHFATFPPELPETCIKAGCPPGGVVLDIFFGSGTTGLVADRLQCDCVGIEINPAFAHMAQRRIEGDTPLLAQVNVSQQQWGG